MTLEWTVAVTFGSALRAVLRFGGCFGAMVHTTTTASGSSTHNNIRVLHARLFSIAQQAKVPDVKLIDGVPDSPDSELFETMLPVPTADELLSYQIAAHHKLGVDRPWNMAKSVTVE